MKILIKINKNGQLPEAFKSLPEFLNSYPNYLRRREIIIHYITRRKRPYNDSDIMLIRRTIQAKKKADVPASPKTQTK